MSEIYRQLRGISSDRVVGLGPSKVLSIPDAIGIAIEKWMQEKQGIQQDLLGEAGVPSQPVRRDVVTGVAGEGEGEWRLAVQGHEMEQEFLGACPDCGSQLAFAEGCAKCHVCGYSECG
jgi:ribonucleoside-diphosphate reductase alpha chain